MMTLDELRTIRQRSAYSIRALAGDAGVSPATVLRAEQGQPIHPSTIRKLAKALGVTPAALRGSDAAPAPPPPPPAQRPATAQRSPAEGLAHALAQAERCRAADDLAGAERWEQIAARIAAAVAAERVE